MILIWFDSYQTVFAQVDSQKVLEEQLPYKYYGNNFSHKFHRPSCPFGSCISHRHLVLFHFRKEAIAANFTPCCYCLPPFWLTVHSVILPKQDKNVQITIDNIKESSDNKND